MTRIMMAVVCAALAFTSHAPAQTYPGKPITLLVPFAAGGPADALARAMSERMRVALGQPLVIENVAGAAGATGIGRLVRAAPDGYTIGIGHLGTNVLNGALYPLPYDLLADLAPIALLPSNASIVIARKTMPAGDLKALVAWLKANPEQATVATAGVGSAAHVASVYFESLTGAHLQIVPYRGGGAALNDLVAGHVAIMFDQASNSVEHVRAGTVRAYAVMAPARLASAPTVPTVDEAGVPGLYMSTWYGFWAPKGTPPDIVARLNAAVVETLADPAVSRQMADQGLDIPERARQTPEALAVFQKAEIAKWWPIIKAANIKVE